MEKTKLHLITHVHWDPMWYLSFEEYRIRLIRLVRKLLDILDGDPDYVSFMFDGQVSALDDYLEIIPQDEERIKKHVKSGKLIIGPWYIQPEETMISGESHIRNLMLGLKRANELGGAMKISYLCDMVGHIPQMPQIVRGFGMDLFAGWRGIIDGKARTESEFIWKSPDGSGVLVKVMPYSYHNPFPAGADEFIAHVKAMKEKLLPLAATEYILIMQGGDHLEPLDNLPRMIKKYNTEAGYDEMEHTTLKHHFDCIGENVNNLKTHIGEFRSTYQSFILTGILSTRMGVKLGNEQLVLGLEKWLEPFSSLCSMMGMGYPSELIDYVWRKQLKNAFHDCIYGAHVDSVTSDILSDYKKAGEIINWLVGDAVYNLSRQIDTTGSGCNVTIFNPVIRDRKNAAVEIELFLETETPRRELIVEDDRNNKLPLQISSINKVRKLTGPTGNFWSRIPEKEGYLYALSVLIPEIPAMGYRNLAIRMADWASEDSRREYIGICKDFEKNTDLVAFQNGCENKYLKVEIRDNGLLDIKDKQSGALYQNMHLLEDSGDAGDNYNFSPPVNNRIITNQGQKARVSLIEKGPVRIVFRVETALELPVRTDGASGRSPDTAESSIVYDVILKSSSRVIEFKTRVDNRSMDHRLRVVFPTGLQCAAVSSGSQFYVIDRPPEPEDTGDYIEKPLGNYPHRLFVDMSDGKEGVAFLDRGLPEYQADCRGILSITLLRCIGYLSKDDFPERSYRHAGPRLETPGAQEPGEHLFEYGLYIHRGNWKDADCPGMSEEFYSQTKSVQDDSHGGSLGRAGSFLRLSNDRVLLSAFKKGKGPDEWIIRVYNMDNKENKCVISLFKQLKRAFRTDLNEERLHELDTEDGKVTVDIGPFQIYTISFEIY